MFEDIYTIYKKGKKIKNLSTDSFFVKILYSSAVQSEIKNQSETLLKSN